MKEWGKIGKRIKAGSMRRFGAKAQTMRRFGAEAQGWTYGKGLM